MSLTVETFYAAAVVVWIVSAVVSTLLGLVSVRLARRDAHVLAGPPDTLGALAAYFRQRRVSLLLLIPVVNTAVGIVTVSLHGQERVVLTVAGLDLGNLLVLLKIITDLQERQRMRAVARATLQDPPSEGE